MPVNYAKLRLITALQAVEQTIALLDLALDDNPSPDLALELEDKKNDLELLRSKLQAQLDQMNNGAIVVPAPNPGALAHLNDLLAQVNQATLNGSTAQAKLALAGKIFSAGLTVLR
ncbi:hypothetical protein [Polaromonas sp.]|uniref:hypothetical protein n=1 Tax=Polaromonas sp. TaxID=1869339 RepID=UPI0032641FC9